MCWSNISIQNRLYLSGSRFGREHCLMSNMCVKCYICNSIMMCSPNIYIQQKSNVFCWPCRALVWGGDIFQICQKLPTVGQRWQQQLPTVAQSCLKLPTVAQSYNQIWHFTIVLSNHHSIEDTFESTQNPVTRHIIRTISIIILETVDFNLTNLGTPSRTWRKEALDIVRSPFSPFFFMTLVQKIWPKLEQMYKKGWSRPRWETIFCRIKI